MPISVENMRLYPGGSIRSPEWRAIVSRIGERSGWKCERCKAPHNELICRGEGDDAGTYMLSKGEVIDIETGEHLGYARGSEYQGRFVKVVLTVAHIEHDLSKNEDEDLMHWCQRCHNMHDVKHRQANASRTRRGHTIDMPAEPTHDQ